VIWLIDAVLKWLPGFSHGYMGYLTDSAQGQPGWLHWWFRFWIDLQRPHPYAWAYLVAVIETLIALALIFGFARKATYIFAALFSLVVWATVEGFGGPYTSGSTDIGTGIIYAVVFMGFLALNYEAGPARLSVDYLIEQHVPWWHRIAEVEGRQRKRASTTQSQAPSTQAPLAT
jgi:uncharacterized membrane protein YphA (DoxX/SURF4 family)